MIDYTRVIPRDLFNEAKLLKCMGNLCLKIHDNQTPVKIIFHHDDEPFNVVLLEEGSLTIANINVWVKKQQFIFKTTYNSKANYPLYVEKDFCDYLVFDEKGNFADEFINFCNKIVK